MDKIKTRNGKNLTEAEEIKNRWQGYIEELYKRDLNEWDNHDSVVTHQEPDILECKVKWASGSIVVAIQSTQSCPTLWHHGLQHTRPLCPSPSPKVFPSSCPLHWWCHPAISTSDILFSSALNLSQPQGLFQWVSYLYHMNKILELHHQSFQWKFRVDFPYNWLVWSPCCPREFHEFSPAPQFEGNNSLMFCLLYGPALTIVCDHWEYHSHDFTDLCQQSNVSAFQHTVKVCHRFPAKKQLSSDFMVNRRRKSGSSNRFPLLGL